jgi:tRNA threonylcarbamoyladenosine biosynthesis protein TsaB
MKHLLALETSGLSCGVALAADGAVMFAEDVREGAVHGRALAPLIEKALKHAGIEAAELAAVAVSSGPGSWTGLRIGLSAAKALAWGIGKPLVLVPSFEALALAAMRSTPAAGRAVLCLRDARSEGFFGALFSETSQPLARWIEECVRAPQALFEAARKRAAEEGRGVAVCGDAVCVERAAAFDAEWLCLNDLQHVPARELGECAWARFASGMGVLQSAAEIHAAAPLYLRASDPELKLARKP